MPHFSWKDRSIFYREQGAGPLLVVLPGNTASSRCHQGELDYFFDRFRVAALDFLGTGGSGRLPVWAGDWWAESAAQASALVEHLGYAEAILIGTSGGAVAALRAALQFPERVRAVIADSFSERFSIAMAAKKPYSDHSSPSPPNADKARISAFFSSPVRRASG
jgi:pimeloyl-ACP methyl ester carboxylesterase